jgi:hypothetical protein
VTTMEANSMFTASGAPSTRSMLKSLALHVLVLALLMLIPGALFRKALADRNKQIDVVFYRPSQVAAPRLPSAPPPNSKPNAVASADRAVRADLPPSPVGAPVEAQPQRKVGNAGILAFREQLASLAKDQLAPRLGADARYGAADEVGRASSPSRLTTSTPGSSGGINVASLNRGVGGGGGGGIQGVSVGRATSSISGVGGGDRPKARGGPGPARTDEEIQIVFDRYKSAFYRLYNRELRNTPTLKGQMVVRLTIEPDGSVSMCVLQSSDMNAPDLAAQVVSRVKTMNFGAKEGVQAITIMYPIDFLPAA